MRGQTLRDQPIRGVYPERPAVQATQPRLATGGAACWPSGERLSPLRLASEAPGRRGERSTGRTAGHGSQGLEETALAPGPTFGYRAAGARSRGRPPGSGRLSQVGSGRCGGKAAEARGRRTLSPAPRRGGEESAREVVARLVRARPPRSVSVTRQSRTARSAAGSGRRGPSLFRLRLEPLPERK